jgi:lysosomal acid lipase/cholesteryl ester hydrolase
MTFEQVVADKGFDIETHLVRTEDGYLLKLFRIRDKKIIGKNAKVVFMQHGLLASGGTFIKYADDNTPVFNLAREGYDVWIGNNRGNLYSHSNDKIDWKTDPRDFHDYSFQDLGKYDLPVMID